MTSYVWGILRTLMMVKKVFKDQTTEKDSTGVNPIRKQISLTLAQAQIKAILVLEYRVCTTNPDDFENRQYEKS